MKRTPSKRTGEIERKPMRRGPSQNSQPHRDKDVTCAYADSHPFCLLCGDPTECLHHIRRGTGFRVDHPANLAALCWDCHEDVHSPKSVFAEKTIEILHMKWVLGEFDPAAWDAIGGPFIEGWLAMHEPEVGTDVWRLWDRLVSACKGE